MNDPTSENAAGARQHRERQIDAIHRVCEALFVYSSVNDLISETLRTALEVVDAEVGSFQLHDPRTDNLVFCHVIDPHADRLVGFAVPASNGINGRVLRTGVSDLSHHVQQQSNWNPEIDARMGYHTKSMMTVPIKRPTGVAIGVMQIVNGRRSFDRYDLEVLEVLCAQAAHRISSSRHMEEMDRTLSQLQTLRNVDIALAASLDLQMTTNVVVEQVLLQMKVDAVSLLLFNPRSRTLDYVAGRGFRTRFLQQTRLALGEGLAGQAALQRRPVHIGDMREHAGVFARAPLFESEGFISYNCVPLVANGQLKGVIEVFERGPRHRDFELLELLETLALPAALALDRVLILDEQRRTALELASAYDATLEGLARSLDVRDREPEGHTLRVTEFTLRLARHMGVPEEEMVHYKRGALLHDIGKMAIPDSILLKPTPLTPQEWDIVKKHPLYSYELLSSIPLLRPALDIPYCHHEKWDGTGYPRALWGEQIPLAARIFAVADAWDAMRADRPYRVGWPEEKIRQHIAQHSGTFFDPQVVAAFEQLSRDSTLQ